MTTPTTDQLRDLITTAISKWHRDPEQPLYTQGADAVLAVFPAPALAVARQVLGTTDQQPTPVLDGLAPIELRWDLDDGLYGDDDTTTALLSGSDGGPYWVELDPERTAALRDAPAGPEPEDIPVDRAAVLHADLTPITEPTAVPAEVRMCPAKNGKWGRICNRPDGHAGFHAGAVPNGSVTWEGDAP